MNAAPRPGGLLMPHTYPEPPNLPLAACHDLPDPEVMHPNQVGRSGKTLVAAERRAKQICATCPITSRAACLSWALDWPGTVSGVWGGLTEGEIAELKGDRP